MNWRPVTYDYDTKGNIIIPKGAPFDGKPVLIRLGKGAVEAWWDNQEHWSTDTPEGPAELMHGFEWVCLDGDFAAELDEAQYWCPMPSDETTLTLPTPEPAVDRAQFLQEPSGPSARDIALADKMKQYYENTADLGNKAAMPITKKFHQWWKGNGYTRREYNQAKQNYEQYIG